MLVWLEIFVKPRYVTVTINKQLWFLKKNQYLTIAQEVEFKGRFFFSEKKIVLFLTTEFQCAL